MAAQFPFQQEPDRDIYDLDSYHSGPTSVSPKAEPEEPKRDIYDLDSYHSTPEVEPEPEERTLWDETKEFVGDSVLDLGKGVIQLGDSFVGLGSLLTGGLLNEGMKAIGYRPEEAQQFLSDMQSDDRKRQEKELEAAKGWKDVAMKLITEPALLGGKVVETAPMMLGIMGAAKAFAARAYTAAYGAAIKSGAAPTAAAKVAIEASVKAATKAAATAEGAMQSGSSFQQFMNEGMDLGTAYVASIGSGITTGMTAFASGGIGNKIGLGDVEAGNAAAGNFIARFFKGGLQEGLLEEAPQSAMEQMWSNYAHERPLTEGVEEAATTGGMIGAVAGGGFSMANSGKSDPTKPDQSPALFNPTHNINGQPVQQVTKRGQLVPNTYVNQAGDIVRTQSAESLTGQPVDISLDVDAVAEQMKAEVGAATNAYNLPETIDMPTGLVAGQMGDASQLFTDMQEPNLGEEIQYDAVDDGTMDSQDASQLFTDVMGEDISYAEDRAVEAATAAENPVNALPEPTEAQKAAGNYKKAHTKVQGFDVSIENPVGSERKGTDKDGNPWSRTMTDDYGYLKRTIGADSDPNAAPHQIEQVDTFVKHDADIPADNPVYIIDQAKEDGSFDETKVMMGYSSAEEASERYNANYAEGWAGLKNITEATPEQLRAWLKDPAANDEYAEYLKGTPKRLQPAASEAQENAQFFADRVKAVKDAASQVEMPDKVKDADTMVSLVRDYAKATDEAGWELVDALDDASIKEVIGPARRWDGSVKGYGPFYAIENVGRWVETLGQSKAMRDQAIADGTAPNDVAVNIENVEDITKAPFDAKDMLARREDKQQYVYHATRKSKADKIKQGGLKPLQTSNWKKQGQSDTERYNEDGGVFAFESAEDAAKWAFKMNYEFKDAVSIIKAKRDGSWEVDPSEDITLQTGKGKSLKRVGAVPASDIVSSTDLDFETSAADRGMTGAEYIKKVAAELEADAPAPFNPDDMLASRGPKTVGLSQRKKNESPKVKAFMDEYKESTLAHPLMPQSRIVMNRQLNTGDDFAMLDVTPTTDENNNDGLYLGAIQSSATGKGNGNAGMKALTDLADKHGLPITLGAKAFGTTEGMMTTPQLKKWYRKWGFRPSETRDPDTMVRPPKRLQPRDMLARREDSDPYAKMRGVEYSYQVQVESTGQVHTVTADAAETMMELDARVAALEELRACI